MTKKRNSWHALLSYCSTINAARDTIAMQTQIATAQFCLCQVVTFMQIVCLMYFTGVLSVLNIYCISVIYIQLPSPTIFIGSSILTWVLRL